MQAEKEKENRAESEAKAQLENILEIVKELEAAQVLEDVSRIEKAQQTIQESPLEVSVRSGWHSPGEKGESAEFLILLCWGGPAVRITGDLGLHDMPESACLEFQDWGTFWTECLMTTEEEGIVLQYCRQFYFGG